MSWTPDQAKALADTVLSFSKAPECEVSLRLSHSGHTRFAANEITTAGMVREVSVSITSRDGGKSGSTTTGELDPSLLREAVARSEALMASAQPDPEHVESLAPQDYPTIAAFDDATAAAGPLDRRDGVKAALDLARGKGLNGSGFFETGAPLAGDRQQERQFRVSPLDRRRVLHHHAHRRRHRLGLCKDDLSPPCRPPG